MLTHIYLSKFSTVLQREKEAPSYREQKNEKVNEGDLSL